MAGIDPYPGEKVYYPGEKDSKRKRAWHGSPMWGGGLADFIGPICFFLAACVLALAFS